MSLGLRNLSELVRAKFVSAKNSGHLTLAATEVCSVKVANAVFQVRYCPSLAQKPKPATSETNSSTSKKFDPFENPEDELLISPVPTASPQYTLVLNKYPIIQNHFILATKQNKPQTYLLEKEDIHTTFQCLREWTSQHNPTAKLFGFFNSGEHSGASQPHRHVQFLSEEDMTVNESNGLSWSLLVESNLSDTEPILQVHQAAHLPFLSWRARVDAETTAEELHTTYLRLYHTARQATRNFDESQPSQGAPSSESEGPAQISYNLGMTKNTLMICPRRSEGKTFYRNDGSAIDNVQLNGTVLGGTLMVKNEELYEILKQDSTALHSVLEEAGVPHPEKNRNNL